MGIVAGVFVGYRFLLPAAIPFLAAWMLAAWLYPATVRIEKKTGIKKSLGGAVLLALVFGAAGLLLYLGAAELLSQLKTAVSNFPVLLRWGTVLLDKCCVAIEDMTGILREDSKSYILTQMAAMQDQLLAVVSPGTFVKLFSCVKGLLVAASGAVVTFILSILIIGDMENLRKKIWDYSWLVGTRRVVKRLKKTTVTYLKAQAVIMALVAVVCTVGFWLLGSPYFLILGIVLGALDALPLIGTGTFLYPAAVIFLVRGNAGIAAGCVALDIVTSLLREILEPRLLGGKLGVSPIAVLASVYIGVFLFGGFGVVLGPLSFSTIYEIGKEWDVWD
ncbi:MAG: AI-2E family transporter [Eubacteriales bacterium]|nr:AI-2E family transporter [Eubacteriales bacterium]